MGEEVEITTKRPVPLLCALPAPSVPLRSTPLCLSPHLGPCFYSAMENCLDLAIRTGGAAGSDAPTQTLIRLIRRTGRPADTLVYKSHTRVCVYILRKGCPPVRLVYPLPSILRFALTSSMPLSRTNHPRVRAFPIRLLWKPACCSTIPKRLILIGFLMEPQETSLSEISAVVINRPSPARVMSK